MRAQISQSRGRYIITLVIIAIALWAAQHVLSILEVGSLKEYVYSHWVFIFSFIMLVVAITLAHREKPIQAIDSVFKVPEHVTAVVPAYNEDPTLLRECLESLVVQSQPLQEIYLIDDGSNKSDYSEVEQWFGPFAAEHNVQSHWIRRDNGGKRQAQSSAFRVADEATVFITVDSDSVLDYSALEELLKPFDDPKVQSVAGVVLARNNTTNMLARITDLLFVTGQLIDRSMMSSLGSVLVNSGGLAAYRAEVVRDNLDSYLNESFFGQHIEFSDDSMLTLYALERGRTVQQPTAFVFTMMPDKMSHHIRQQNRWMKGSFIRSWWRLKYLPLTSFGFARQAIGWLQFVITTVLLVLLLIVNPIIHHEVIPYIILTPIMLGYAQALRYFSVKRSDESFGSQLATYLMTPLAVLWSYFVLRPIRVYAALTCLKSSWGTRDSVEVTLEVAPSYPLRQKLVYLGKLSIMFETNYETLARAVYELDLGPELTEQFWIANYQQMSKREKRALWRDYKKVQNRNAKLAQSVESSRRVMLRLHRKPRFVGTDSLYGGMVGIAS